MPRRKPSSPREAPDPPRRAGDKRAMRVVERGVRLSASRLWSLQRDFFVQQDPLDWGRGRVPSYITSNAFIARATARVVSAFFEDAAAGRLGTIDRARPMHIVELGAGSGRFAYGVLRELEARAAGAAREGVRARYVLTDLDEKPLRALRGNPMLARFVDDGVLDFAVVDAQQPGDVRLWESGETLRPSTAANPIVALANYFFDGVPADLYEMADGALHESLLDLSFPKDADPGDPASIGDFDASFVRGGVVDAPYADPAWDAILRRYAERHAEGFVLFPIAGLRLVRHLRALGGGRLLLVASDRGHVHEEALMGLEAPRVVRHGSFSIDVNFHALGEHARDTGGIMLAPAHHPTQLATVALLWGAGPGRAQHGRTAEAFHDHLEAGGPEDLFALKTALDAKRARLDVETALAWLRASAWDAEVFLACAPVFVDTFDGAALTVRLDLLDAARRVRDAYYPVGGDRDVHLALAELMHFLDALPEAEALYAESVRRHGPNPITLHQLAVCASALHRLGDALARVEEALALDPTYEPARAMRIALQAELRRRPTAR